MKVGLRGGDSSGHQERNGNAWRADNTTSAWAVDREFFGIYLFPWLPLASFGFPWGDFGFRLIPLGTLWGMLWFPLAPFMVPLGSLWPSFGIPLAVLGHNMEPG